MEKLLLSDAHCHFVNDEDLQRRIDLKITSLVSNSNKAELDALRAKDLPEYIIPSFGIHPWSADKYAFEDVITLLDSVEVVGEIGMDNTWCDVSLKIQEDIFKKQLAYAKEHHKAVVLHTKGQEKEIAKLIHEYPNKYLVHWYSCEDYLDEYIKEDCYFSIGPDVFWNKATQNVAHNVPLNRILSETDGLNAVMWAIDEGPKDVASKSVSLTDEAIMLVIEEIAKLRKLSKEECIKITYDNLVHGFLNK